MLGRPEGEVKPKALWWTAQASYILPAPKAAKLSTVWKRLWKNGFL